MRDSLAHVEGEAEVLLLGEEQDEEVVPRLALLDGRVQADLWTKKKKNHHFQMVMTNLITALLLLNQQRHRTTI